MPNEVSDHSADTSGEPKQRVQLLQRQLERLTLQRIDLKHSLIGFDRKKDSAGTLFLAGSILFALMLLSSPDLVFLGSIILMIYGIAAYFRGRSDGKAAQQRLSEIDVEISAIKSQLARLGVGPAA